MNKNEIKQKLMDYLYDEMGDTERTEFEEYIRKNPDVKREFHELQGVRKVLEKVPVPEKTEPMANKPLPFTPVSNQSENSNRTYHAIRYMVAVAAIFLATLLTFSFINLQVGSNENGFYVLFGENNVAQEQAVNEEMLADLLNQIRDENALFVAAMVEQSSARQTEQIEEVLSALTDYYDQRRQQDLLLIAEGFSQLEQDTYYRFMQTDEVIGEIIFALSNPNQ
ncbi:MAG: hypothetical protein EA391_09760 [Balneolaceae bacterium]|nr:MAG: hypothetical protein EA391_09760 [Balneolaceae bacterium]